MAGSAVRTDGLSGHELRRLSPKSFFAGADAGAVLAGSAAAFFLGPAGIFVGMLLVPGAGAWLLSRTRNDIQTWLLSTQWRRVPPGEDDVPAIYPDERMEKAGYMALTVQEDAHV